MVVWSAHQGHMHARTFARQQERITNYQKVPEWSEKQCGDAVQPATAEAVCTLLYAVGLRLQCVSVVSPALPVCRHPTLAAGTTTMLSYLESSAILRQPKGASPPGTNSS